jgi:hypothetical protein
MEAPDAQASTQVAGSVLVVMPASGGDGIHQMRSPGPDVTTHAEHRRVEPPQGVGARRMDDTWARGAP